MSEVLRSSGGREVNFCACQNSTKSDILFAVSSKKDPNTTCEEGRIEMTVIVFFKQELHCGE